VTVFKKVK